jgi:hypothetical protein
MENEPRWWRLRAGAVSADIAQMLSERRPEERPPGNPIIDLGAERMERAGTRLLKMIGADDAGNRD